LGRFHGIDALAAMSPGLTPYHFANNNPIVFSDPSGLRPEPMREYLGKDFGFVGSNGFVWNPYANKGHWSDAFGGVYGSGAEESWLTGDSPLDDEQMGIFNSVFGGGQHIGRTGRNGDAIATMVPNSTSGNYYAFLAIAQGGNQGNNWPPPVENFSEGYIHRDGDGIWKKTGGEWVNLRKGSGSKSLGTWAGNQVGKKQWTYKGSQSPLGADCWKCNLFVSDGLKSTNNGDAFYPSGNPVSASDYSGGGPNLPNYKRVWRAKNNGKSLPSNFLQHGDIIGLKRANGTAHLGVVSEINGIMQIVGAGVLNVTIQTEYILGEINNAVDFSVWRKQ